MIYKKYIISDLHFNHESLLCTLDNPRPLDYTERLYKHLSLLSDTDILYCLGDICIGCDKQMHEQYIIPLKCKKVLVRGNHDKKSDNWYLNHGWDIVCESIIVSHQGKKYLLSHQPDFDSQYINIHGHYHNRYELDRFDDQFILYSAEREHYMPRTIDELIKKDKHRKQQLLINKQVHEQSIV